MITLTLVLILAGLLSAGVRLKCHKWIAFAAGVVPAFLVLVYFVVRWDLAMGHGIVPMWMVAAVLVVLSSIVSAVAALAVPGPDGAA